MLKASTPLNSEMVDLPVEEDDIVIFPSKTYHGTDPNNTNGARISIAVDVVMTLKDATGVEFLLPPRTWPLQNAGALDRGVQRAV